MAGTSRTMRWLPGTWGGDTVLCDDPASTNVLVTATPRSEWLGEIIISEPGYLGAVAETGENSRNRFRRKGSGVVVLDIATQQTL